MQDLIFKTPDFVFSYRIAGILIHNGKILLQKPLNDDGYSIPGGHVAFNETSDITLIREFKEEINADIRIERLILIGETFFPWGKRPCQQISLYYLISLQDNPTIPLNGTFRAQDEIGNERIDLDFCWIPLTELGNIKLYPLCIKEYITNIPQAPIHFVYRQ